MPIRRPGQLPAAPKRDLRQAHACLDLETLALSLDAVIVSIGVVSWLEGDDPGHFRHTFELKLDLNQPGRRIDPSTIVWWMAQSDEARAATFGESQASLEHMRVALIDWLSALGDPLVWTHDPSFDAALLKDDQGNAPWYYRNTRCCRTAAEYVTNEECDDLKELLNTVPHSVLDDAKLSAAQVQLFRNKTAALRPPREAP
jgi:hypothetical protein